ncbi:MAG TPA: response regulator [Catenuloplanes sp.]
MQLTARERPGVRPTEPAGGWERRLFAAATALVALAVVAVALALTADSLDSTGRRVVSDAAFVLGSLAAVVTTSRAALRSTGRLRAAWTLLAGNAGAWAVGNSFWFYYQNIAAVQPFPTEADIWYALAICFGAAGLLTFPMGRRVGPERTRAILDALIITSALLAASSGLVLKTVLAISVDGPLAAAALIIPPVGDIVLATLALLLLSQAPVGHRLPLALVGVAYLVYTVSDSTYAYQGAQGTFTIGSLLDLGWITGYLLLALAAVAPAATRPVPARVANTPAPVLSGIVVYGALVTLVVVTAVNPNPYRRLEVVLPGVLALVLFGVRQILLAAENGRLRRDLEATVAERTEELRQLSQRSERIVLSVADGLYGVDLHSRIQFVNPAAAELLGHPEEALLGQSAHDCFHVHGQDQVTPRDAERCKLVRALSTGEVIRDLEAIYRRADGTTFVLESTTSPIVDDSGRITGAVTAFRDITERRAVERMKNEFISVVSHELRTPLTSIRGSLGLVSSGKLGELPEAAGRMVSIALQSSERLTRLINDILDLERISSGAVPLELAEHQAADLIAETVAVLGPVADDAAVTLRTGPTPGRVHADSDRVIQTLTNLVGNAIKFSPRGGTVTVSTRPGTALVEFSVADEGRGVPADKRESIFGRFQQVDSSDARDKGGTGLGLAICRTIVERHGGRIWVHAGPGDGSQFQFTLPSVTDDRREPTGVTDAATGKPVVLVVDDDSSVLAMLAEVLQRNGLRVVTVREASQALQVAINDRPAALLVDLRMPGMTGRDLVGQLNGNPATAGIPVVVLSVDSPAEDPELARSVTDWVTKPSDEQSISNAVLHAVALSQSPRVLVVEDDDDLAAVLTAMLGRHGVQVDRAATEADAIASTRHTRPDVIVLDLGLPDGDGFGLVDAWRHDAALAAVPIVVYSAADVTATDRPRLQLGRTQFLTKSRIAPEEVERRVVALMDRVISSPDAPTTVGSPR